MPQGGPAWPQDQYDQFRPAPRDYYDHRGGAQYQSIRSPRSVYDDGQVQMLEEQVGQLREVVAMQDMEIKRLQALLGNYSGVMKEYNGLKAQLHTLSTVPRPPAPAPV